MQETAYEVRISDWSSDVCSSDLSDRPVMSAAFPLRLPVDDARDAMGVVVRLPVYSSGPRPSDVAQRRAREIGALGISMRVRPMLLAALPPVALHRYRVRVLDTPGEPTMTLYDSRGHLTPRPPLYRAAAPFGEPPR